MGSYIKEAPSVRRGEARAPPEEADLHLRYVVRHRNGKTYVGHRQYNYRDGSFAAYGPFKNARMWVRRTDAEKQVRKDDQVVEVTCVVGRPFAVYMK